MKTLREQIESVISGISCIEKVNHAGNISNPRQVAMNFRYTIYKVESAELTGKTLRNKAVTFNADKEYTDEQIRKAIEALVDSAIRWHEAREARFAEDARREKAAKDARDAKQSEWIAKLRVAKSGQSETPIEGTEHQFRVLTAPQLIEAGNEHGAFSIRVPLPADLDARADFLARLDSFLQSSF